MRLPQILIVYLFISFTNFSIAQIIETKLVASDRAPCDLFGGSVSISSEYIIIGAHGNDDNGSSSGSAYIFYNDPDLGWIEQIKLTPSDGVEGDFFGYSVAISGNWAIIGAPYSDDNGNQSGSAYVFYNHPNLGWIEQKKLTHSDRIAYSNFGLRIAMSGDYAIIGAPSQNDFTGSAYIFYNDPNSGWIEQCKLTASDGSIQDEFAHSVAITEGFTVVGADRKDIGNETNAGAAYIFYNDPATGWVEQKKITASDGAANDYFGISVAITNSYAIIGAHGYDDNGSYTGSAYIFYNDPTTGWIEQKKITASDGWKSNYFGISVAVLDNWAIIGASGNDDDFGSAYVFYNDPDLGWKEQKKLIPSDGLFGGNFCGSVGLSNDFILIGQDEEDLDEIGTAYVYSDYTTSPVSCEWGQIKRMPRITFGWMPEFSGCIPSNDDGRFIVYSDERTLDEVKDPRGPAYGSREEVWLIDAPSASLVQTLSLNGKKLTDIEAMADDGAGGFFICTSQSLRQDGTQNDNREKLFRYNDPGDTDTRNNFRDVLIYYFPFLKAFVDNPSKQNGIDVEGIAVDPKDDKMWFGLRGPLVDKDDPTKPGDYAVLLELDHPIRDWDIPNGKGIKEEDWWGFQWQPPRFLNLGSRGIRDLYFDIPTRRFFILAGKMDGNDVGYTPSSFLFEYSFTTEEVFYLMEIPQVDDGVPEQYRAFLNPSGLCEAEGITAIECSGQRGLVIVYDSKEQGIYQIIPFPDVPTAVHISSDNEINNVPRSFVLYQNYQNPFNPNTTIRFSIPKQSYVEIKVYSMIGREIATLLSNQKSAGTHSVEWNGKNESDEYMPSGLYLYSIKAGNYEKTNKMLLIK